MIERDNMGELRGQYELDDLLPVNEGTGNRGQGTGIAEGYDAEGNLMDVEALPEELPHRSGEVARSADRAPKSEKEEAPQTSAEGRLNALAVEINAITEQTRGVVISAALAVGKRLIEAKSLCPAGRFGEWLEKSVSYSERKAQDMMRLYVEYGREGAIPESIAALDYSKAVALLSAPAEAREQLAEKAAEEDMSVRQLQGEISRLKAEKLKAQMVIEDMGFKLDRQKEEISTLDERQQTYDRAIVERDERLRAAEAAVEREHEAASVAMSKAAAAEAAAEELRKMRSAAEDRADANEQRARDAVDRANRTAKDLAEARAKIAAMEEAREQGTGNGDQEAPAERIVEVVPEEITKELADLRARLAEARANQGTGNGDIERPENSPVDCFQRDGAGRPIGTGMAATATEKFKWFYNNQMKPAFSTALELLREVARENPKAADLFATALTKGCEQLMNQLGVSEE